MVSTATHGQLIQVNEGGKTGYRLLGANPLNHGDTGNNAVDLSTQTVASGLTGATGDYSFAVGSGNSASALGAIVGGVNSDATEPVEVVEVTFLHKRKRNCPRSFRLCSMTISGTELWPLSPSLKTIKGDFDKLSHQKTSLNDRFRTLNFGH